MSELLKFIEDLIQNNNYKHSQKTDNYISFSLKNKDGFLIYSNDEFYQDVNKLSNFSQKTKKYFNKYLQRHRFYFYQKINGNIPPKNLTYILYNPSYATPETNDPTINNCINLAQDKYSNIEIINIYSERNPDVKKIATNDNGQNMEFVKTLVEKRNNSDIVFAWGKKKLPKEWKEIIENIKKDNIKIISSEGLPKNIIKHPGNQSWNSIGRPFKNNAKLYTPEEPLKIDYLDIN